MVEKSLDVPAGLLQAIIGLFCDTIKGLACVVGHMGDVVCDMNLRGFIHGDIGKSNITYKDGKFYLIDYEFVEKAENNKYDIKDMFEILKNVYDIEYPEPMNNINKLEYSEFVEKIKEFLDTI